MKVSVIIPHHKAHDCLNNCLKCLDNSIFDIIVVSGGSFAENCNKGAKIANDKIIFLNDDTLPRNEDLLKIIEALDKYDFVGSTQITKNNQKYYGIGLFKRENGSIYHNISVEEGYSLFPSGFCFGFNKNKWEEIGGFNEIFKTGNEDVDLGIRAIKNNIKMCILDLEIKHLESQSEGRFDHLTENENNFYKMYNKDILKEIYENTNKLHGIK